MADLRRDPLVDRLVIIAENRAQRPGAFSSASLPASDESQSPDGACPFCPGNEDQTPGEVFALRPAGSVANEPDWRVRIVPNKYPAFERQCTESPPATMDPPAAPLYRSVSAHGVHEVIIDTPRHVTTVGELTSAELAVSLTATRDRLLMLRQESPLKHALIFKNVGRAAGATRDHLHSQLIAMEIVPPLIAEELRGAAAFYEQFAVCAYCRMVEFERAWGVRLVAESRSFVALCPFASRFAYELWILPRQHASHFEQTATDDLDDLAKLARGAIARIEQLSHPTAYNLIIHTSPFDSLAIDHYHWHIEVAPRLTVAAGFEWGSGCAINPVSPETAAARLRFSLHSSADDGAPA